MVTNVRMSGPTLKVLKLLLDPGQQQWFGIEIVRRMGLAPGTVYPILQRLEIAKWVEYQWEKIDPSGVGRPRRCFYRLTAAGRAAALEAFAEYQLT